MSPLVSACFMALAQLLTGATAPASQPATAELEQELDRDERYVLVSQVEDEGSAAGVKLTASIRVRRSSDGIRWREERQLGEGKSELYIVETDAGDRLRSWKRITRGPEGTATTTLKLVGAKLQARFESGDGDVVTRAIAAPERPYVVVPLLKKVLSDRVAAKQLSGTLTLVVVKPDGLDRVDLEYSDRGQRRISTSAGTRDCRCLEVGASSSLIKLAMPPGEMCFDIAPSHPLVLGRGQTSRFGKSLRTELSRVDSAQVR